MRFSINSRVLEHLGRDLITSDEIAITELIKNAYDANAKVVQMYLIDDISQTNLNNTVAPVSSKMLSLIKRHLSNDRRILVLEDNGDGMSYQDLETGFFTIGTDIKKKQKSSAKSINQRLPLGEKGIGRLAAQRLSKVLFIETTSSESNVSNVVRINWEDFIKQGASLEQIEIESYKFPKTINKFTRLWFLDLNVEFGDFVTMNRSEQLNLFEESKDKSDSLKIRENLQSALSFLMSPFDDRIEDFDIKIYLNETKVNSKFKNEALNVAETIHDFKLETIDGHLHLDLKMILKPWYIERIHQRLVGKNLFNDWRKLPEEYKKLLDKYEEKYKKSLEIKKNEKDIQESVGDISLDPIKKISPIKGKVFSFKRDPALSAMAIHAAKETNILKKDYNIRDIRSFLDSNNGIKLYRGKYRIATLGNKDSDWLELQQARTKGQQFFRFELGNVIGYIEINDPFQNYIRETSSRMNLADNPHSRSLFVILQKVFNEIFYSFSRSAYYITRDILKDEGMLPTYSIEKLKERFEDTDKQVENGKQHLNEFESLLLKAQNIISADGENKMLEADLVLKSLSSKGTVFKEAFEKTLNQLNESKELVKQVEQEKELIELETYNNYKLMANGLVTEVLTHELHSILTNFESKEDIGYHLKATEDYLLSQSQYDLFEDHFLPIREQTTFFSERIRELSLFYGFMEKTFLYKGTIEEFDEEDVHSFIENLIIRLDDRLKSAKVTVDFSELKMKWLVPTGVLIHIFYNLIDNSIYWIKERRLKQKYDKVYQRLEQDFIKIEKKDDFVIHYYDTGTGVIPRMENTLFQPLESGKERNGRGMGLYIIRQLLRSFGADIELLQDRNEFGNRYIFAIYLSSEEKEHAGQNR
ncbi:ATP-binding protein [Bacillus sp. ISL-39]|uniref:ATP-binding protein n=1 Tax=Bacillus sp. ISL-39 TaxID=2819124 RepID=UPI001BE7C412|nr:ATP-binding protein [Bacillus sp. ISL-39]